MSEQLFSQHTREIRITLKRNRATVHDVVVQIAKQAGVGIGWSQTRIPLNQIVDVDYRNIPWRDAMSDVLRGTGATVTFASNGQTVYIGSAQEVTQAATGSVMGRVIDSASRKGLRDATITVPGTKLVTLSQENGTFRLNDVPVGTQQLNARLLGYTGKTVTVSVDSGKASSVNFSLATTSTTLSEVVTTATGRQRRVEVGNDIAVVRADSIMRTAPITSVSELLAVARVPGVEVTPSSGNPGSPSRIRIRGVTSINSNNDPIVVVDGVRIYAPTSSEALQSRTISRIGSGGIPVVGGTYSGEPDPSPLDALDPASIETIEIIRGPSAAAVYGSDAGNGVIIITTKKGRPGKVVWDTRFEQGWGELPRRASLGRIVRVGTSALGPEFGNCTPADWASGSCILDSVLVLRNANDPRNDNEGGSQNRGMTISVSGGSTQVRYFLSGSHSGQIGNAMMVPLYRVLLAELNNPAPDWALKPVAYDRNNLTTSVSVNPKDALELSLSLNFSQTNKREANNDAAVRELDFNNFESPTREDAIALARNPDFQATFNRGLNEAKETKGTLSLQGSWRLPAGVTPRLTVGLDQSTRPSQKLHGRFSCEGGGKGCSIPRYDISGSQNTASTATVKLQGVLPDPLARWNRWVSLRPSIGADLFRSTVRRLDYSAFPVQLGSTDINVADTINLGGKDENQATGGAYISLNIGVLRRVYTELAYRMDEGSTFRVNKNLKKPTFPKLSQSYLISDEPFFPKTRMLKTLRLRGAIGYSANQPGIREVEGGYNQFPIELFPGRTVSMVFQGELPNFSLRPEKIVEFEYGGDAGLFDERVMLNITMAEKRTYDAHLTYEAAPSTGAAWAGSRFKRNVGDVLNRSVEVGLETRLLDRKFVGWNLDVSFSSLLNRLVELDREGLTLTGGTGKLEVGYPLNGVWANTILSYTDLDGNGVITSNEYVKSDSTYYVGWGHPRYSLSYRNTISFLNGAFRLTANLAQDVGLTQSARGVESCSVMPFCTIEEQIVGFAAAAGVRPYTVSVLRLNAAGITAVIPPTWIRGMKASSASVALLASNLKLWTNYKGRDPQVNSTPIGEGLTDNGTTTPKPRTYQLTVRLAF